MFTSKKGGSKWGSSESLLRQILFGNKSLL